MSESMNSTIFARKWLEREGLFDKDSDYDGWLGETVMAVWTTIANQGHSGASAARLFDILGRIHQDYANNDHPIWQEYWQSDAGKALIASYAGEVRNE